MSFGTFCVLMNEDFYKIKAKSVTIEGVQQGFLLNLEVTQTFKNNQNAPQKISYIFPNDMKLCIYDTTFIVGDKMIKPQMTTREEAKKIYDEAVEKQKIAIYGSNIAQGLTEFKIGNLLPQQICKVILKVVFTGNFTGSNSFFFKFPLDVYTPNGSKNCLNISNNFSFQVRVDETIAKVNSNVKNGVFDNVNKIFKIQKRIENNLNEKSIILNFETIEKIKNSILIGPKNDQYETCALTVVPELSNDENDEKNVSFNEYVFVVDCSGSMRGNSIKNASECLELFVRSVPNNSFFNVVFFGSEYNKLFDESVKYDSITASEAITAAQQLSANLGGTDLYSPFKYIFKNKPKSTKRQVFLITDGEVDYRERILNLVKEKSNENRIFTVGIGRGCDAGLLENIASLTGGACNLVQEGDSISNKIIPLLQSSFGKIIENVEIHVEGDDSSSFEISPFPIPPVNENCPILLYVRRPSNSTESYFSKGILFTGSVNKKPLEIPVTNVIKLKSYPDNEYGCSKGLNYDKVIPSLFAFKLLLEYEAKNDLSSTDLNEAIKLSLSSGILCKYTGYVGMIEPSESAIEKSTRRIRYRYACFCAAPPREFWEPFVDSYIDNDDDDSDEDCDEDKQDIQNDKKKKELDLMSFIRKQNFDGYWEDLNYVNQIVGTNINCIEDLQIDNQKMKSEIIATIVALAAMNVLASDKRSIWNLIEKKAIKWLIETTKNTEIDQIIHKVEGLIPTE